MNSFKRGQRVRLVYMDDPGAPPVGTLGTVLWDTQKIGRVSHTTVQWGNGNTLALVGSDSAEVVEEIGA